MSENVFTVLVAMRPELLDAEARQIEEELRDLGIDRPLSVRLAHWYRLYGSLNRQAAERLARELLSDPIAQEVALDRDPIPLDRVAWIAEIGLKPGVTDPVGESVLKGARDLGVQGLERVETGRRVYFLGEADQETIARICNALLVNEVVHTLRLIPV
ncbi:MAG: hypothetical protein KatS3mg115_1217 [Candidatus Poribacteria bacterium]|nr:MAG: hypothetical protein KatS3mg115_1217 [Candidatus Poribacteria bacterium]